MTVTITRSTNIHITCDSCETDIVDDEFQSITAADDRMQPVSYWERRILRKTLPGRPSGLYVHGEADHIYCQVCASQNSEELARLAAARRLEREREDRIRQNRQYNAPNVQDIF